MSIERFFIIKKDAELYTNFFKHKEFHALATSKIHSIFTEFGIDSTVKFGFSEIEILVESSPELKEKFSKEFLRRPHFYDGIEFLIFKKTSKVFKAYKSWMEAENIEYLPPVSPPLHLTESIGSVNYRLFVYGESIYCSITSTVKEYKLPAGWEEIKGSEFFRVAEEVNKC